MEVVYKKRSKVLKPPNPRPLTSKNRSSSMKQLPINSRPQTGHPKIYKNKIGLNFNSPKKKLFNPKHTLQQQRSSSMQNVNIDFKDGLDFRSVRPKSRYQDKLFNIYWESNQIQPKTIFHNNKNTINNKIYASRDYPDNEVDLIIESMSPIDKILSGERKLYKFPQINWSNKIPSNFLTHVGGNEYNISQTTNKITTRPTSSMGMSNVRNINQNENLSKYTTLNNSKKQRPVTALLKQNNSKKLIKSGSTLTKTSFRPKTALTKNKSYSNYNSNNIDSTIPLDVQTKLEKNNKEKYNYKEQFFNEENDLVIYSNNLLENDIPDMRFTKNIKVANLYPHVASLLEDYSKKKIQNYSIKTNQADTDILDLFDRAQKTHASTLGKVGNFEYYSTHQRIGSFMNFSQHLKIEAIKKIGKDIYRNKRNLLEYQSKHNIRKPSYGELLVNKCPHFRDSNSLFHGFMPFEEQGQKMISKLNKKFNVYDPLDYLPKFIPDEIADINNITEEFASTVSTSIKNYTKYLTSDKFRETDLKKFNKEALRKKIISLIDFELIKKHYNILDNQMSELEYLFYDNLKRIIMNYILRSPFERKRLNITLYPRKILPSSFTIAQFGSFNRNQYNKWVSNYNNSFNYLQNNLFLCNIALSGLINWTRAFNHVDLIYLKNISDLKNYINVIHLDEFWRIQESYINKVFHFMRDIYYRGAILITKKNKALKRKDVVPMGKWTFKGFIPNDVEHFEEYNNENYGMYYDDQLQDFWKNINFQNLIDVRLTPSNIGYVTYFLKKQIDLSESDYEEMSTDSKIKLNNCITTYCTLFFRK